MRQISIINKNYLVNRTIFKHFFIFCALKSCPLSKNETKSITSIEFTKEKSSKCNNNIFSENLTIWRTLQTFCNFYKILNDRVLHFLLYVKLYLTTNVRSFIHQTQMAATNIFCNLIVLPCIFGAFQTILKFELNR